jgi:hypothetical protein
MSATRTARPTAIVSGRFAGTPGQGGATWAILQYALGLRALGWDVFLIEPLEKPLVEPLSGIVEPQPGVEAGLEPPPEVAAYFQEVCRRFDLIESAALLDGSGPRAWGIPYQRLVEVARRADLLLNLSGVLRDDELTGPIPNRVYLDLDPGFTQLWSEVDGLDMGFEGHTHFATVGQGLGEPHCRVPTGDRHWITTLPPVVMGHWPAAEPRAGAFTTVGNWRAYGSIRHAGVHYGQKAHALRPLMDLPRFADERVQLALTIHPDERPDLDALSAGGWDLVDPVRAAGTPDRYRRFICDSFAELGIAKSGYVESDCGWFSDRSACYLASGRPVLAQDTGFSRYLPTGAGLKAFRTLEEAADGLRAIRADYAVHSRAARTLAQDLFDADRVLCSLLGKVGLA